MKKLMSLARVDMFEQRIVFRTARGFFVLLALGASLLFVGGVGMSLWSLVPREIPPPVEPPALAPPSPLSYELVQSSLKELELVAAQKSALGLDELAAPQSNMPQKDKVAERIRTLAEELSTLFPAPTYSWTDQVSRVCTVPSAFGCLRFENRVQALGIRSVLIKALEGYDQEEVVVLLETLIRVLKTAPLEARGELIGPTIDVYRLHNESYRAAAAAQKKQVEEARAAWSAQVEALKGQQVMFRTWGLQGLMVGFGGLILVSLFLAFLAMERHTRRLESFTQALDRLSGSGAAPAPDAMTPV